MGSRYYRRRRTLCNPTTPTPAPGPVTLEGELKVLQPTKRTLLDLDSRFFPLGIQPGNLIELKGPEGSGKTFLCTYLIARLLFVYPAKSVVLLDTTHQFSLQNLISILSHLDPQVQTPSIEIQAGRTQHNSKLYSYLTRFSLIPCYTTEEFLLNFGPGSFPTLETLLLTNPEASLVVIDSLDAFSYVGSLPNPKESLKLPNLLLLVMRAVEKSLTPVICTLSDYFAPPEPVNQSSSSQSSQELSDSGPTTTLRAASGRPRATFEPDLLLNPKYFTHSFQLFPQQRREPKKALSDSTAGGGLSGIKSRPETIAHLTSRRSSKGGPPVPGLNHRLRFSIFSGMLWICEEPARAK